MWFLYLLTCLCLFLTSFISFKNIFLKNSFKIIQPIHFFSQLIYFFNWIKERQLKRSIKKHKCKIKIDKINYWKSYSGTTYDDSKISLHRNLKVGLSPSKKNCFYYLIESPLKNDKNTFHLILKALFVFKIF